MRKVAVRTELGRGSLAAGLMLVLTGCGSVGGWELGRPGAGPRPEGGTEMVALATTPEAFLRTAKGKYVVVDLNVNELKMMDGSQVLWKAPVGTGTGLRLQGDDGEWHFSTPRGVFEIQYKEEMPVWYLPDWYYVEKGLPIPKSDAARRMPNQLGVAAVYLGEEIAIHGTDRPELLGQRVSHGCIRLENKFAQRLYHNVQIGTPVVIVGGEHLDDEPPGPTTDPGRPRGPRPDPLGGVATAEILRRLDVELARERPTDAWVPLASRLITRGLKDDAPALRGLLERAGKAKSPTLNREYGTFLADVFSRGSLRAVVSLARIEPTARERAARSIVEAMLALHAGPLDGPRAPWPTHRVPATVLGPDGRGGWDALRAAEESHRETVGLRTAPQAASR
jgi:hypothetical protein